MVAAHDGPRRHREHQVFSPAAGLVGGSPVPTRHGLEALLVAIPAEAVHGRADLEHDVSAAAAASPIRPAARHVFLPPEVDDAVASLTCGYFDLDFIQEHRTPGGL